MLVVPVGSEVDAVKVYVPGPVTDIPVGFLATKGGLDPMVVDNGRQFATEVLYSGLAQ